MAIQFRSLERTPAIRRPARIRFRFGLRTLLIVTTVLGLTLGLLLREAIDYQRRKDGARELISSLNGTVKDIGWSLEPSPGRNWLSQMLLDTEHLERLWSVDLSGTSVSRADLARLCDCDWVRSLKLSDTAIGDADLEKVAKLTRLRELHLLNTNVSDKGLLQLSDLERLQVLSARGSQVTYAGLSKLDQLLPGMGFAEQLATTHLPLPGVAVHGRFTSVAGLRKFDDEFSMHVGAPSGSSHIHITNGAAITLDTVEHLRQLTSARSMDASFGKVRFKHVALLINSLPELRQLSIDGGQLTDEDFAHIAAIPKLKYLSLVGWHHVSDAAIKQLGENGSLVWLDLNGLDTTLGITSNLGGLKRLRMLELNVWARDANGKYDAASAERIAEAREALKRLRELPSLEVVRLQGNQFTDDAIEVLGEMKGLKQIGYDKRFVNDETIAALRVNLPVCDIRSEGFSDEIDLD